MENVEKKLKDILTITFAVLVLPILLTAAFSRIFLNKNAFSETLAFAVQNPFGSELDIIKCEGETCHYLKDEKKEIHVFKNPAGIVTFSAPKDSLQVLQIQREEILKKLDVYLNSDSCYSDPVSFSGDLIVRKITTKFLPDSITTDLYATLSLGQTGKSKLLLENVKTLCPNLIKPIQNYFIGEIGPTFQDELRKLKIAASFYMIVAFLAFMGLYIYPKYKRQK